MIRNMTLGFILIAVAAIAIGILAWKLHKKESSQEEVINKPVSQPTPVDEVPKEDEKPKEEVKPITRATTRAYSNRRTEGRAKR